MHITLVLAMLLTMTQSSSSTLPSGGRMNDTAAGPAAHAALQVYGFVAATVEYTRLGERQVQTVVGQVFAFCMPDNDPFKIAESAASRLLSDVMSVTGASDVRLVSTPLPISYSRREVAEQARRDCVSRGAIQSVHSFVGYARPASCRS